MNKVHRHRLIARLLQASTVRSQDQLKDLLLASGVRSTQGTLSRDLREMGVLKAPTGYTLTPAENGKRTASELESAVRRHMLSADPAGTIVVLKTEPGHASLLAAQVDLAPLAGIVGSVAGDDTVFLAARTPKDARNVALHFQKLGGIL
jgi:transcriptional regulator of arginine metabolism